MKKLALLRSIALAAAVACSTSVIAQQEGGSRSRQGGDNQSTQTQQSDQSDRAGRGSGGADRGSTGRSGGDRDESSRGSGTTQPGINDTRQTQRSGANTTTADASAAAVGQSGQMSSSVEIQQLLVGKLIHGNKAEVELGKLAQQRAENDQVKQFAQQMVEHHTETLQKLTSLHQQSNGHSGSTGSQSGSTSSRGGQGSTSAGGASGSSGASSSGSGAGGASGSSGASGSGSGAGGASGSSGASGSGSGAGGASGSSGASGSGSGAGGSAHGGSLGAASMTGSTSGGAVLQQLTSIAEQAHEKHLQMTRQMLEQKKGAEFDKAYIGQQVLAHVEMLAHLQAMQGVGDQQFQQLVQQSTQMTQQHLDQAKKTAEQLMNQKS